MAMCFATVTHNFILIPFISIHPNLLPEKGKYASQYIKQLLKPVRCQLLSTVCIDRTHTLPGSTRSVGSTIHTRHSREKYVPHLGSCPSFAFVPQAKEFFHLQHKVSSLNLSNKINSYYFIYIGNSSATDRDLKMKVFASVLFVVLVLHFGPAQSVDPKVSCDLFALVSCANTM